MDTKNLSKTFTKNLFDLAMKCGTEANTNLCEIEFNFPGVGKFTADLGFQFVLQDGKAITSMSKEKRTIELDIQDEFKKDLVTLAKECIEMGTNGCRLEYDIPELGKYNNVQFVANFSLKEDNF